jgi:hypothetical protein
MDGRHKGPAMTVLGEDQELRASAAPRESSTCYFASRTIVLLFVPAGTWSITSSLSGTAVLFSP